MVSIGITWLSIASLISQIAVKSYVCYAEIRQLMALVSLTPFMYEAAELEDNVAIVSSKETSEDREGLNIPDSRMA